MQFAHILRKRKETKWCKLMQQDLLQKRESSLQSTKLDLKKFVKLLWPLWCMNIKNLKHLKERRQAVLVVKMKRNFCKNLLLTHLSM